MEASIANQRKAVQLVEDGHPSQITSLGNLSICTLRGLRGIKGYRAGRRKRAHGI
jgi:hypothetical protein